MADADSVLEQANAWLAEGRRVVWATVVSTWRSSPRPVGSQMIVDDTGRFAGSVSGGCVEAAVIQHAAEVFASRKAQSRAFGVSNEQAWQVGLACGGKIEVLLAEAPPVLLGELTEAARRSEAVSWVSDLDSGEQWRLDVARLEALGAAASAVEQAVEKGESALCVQGERRLFVHVWAAPLRLIVVGAVHLTQLLGELAERCGFELSVVDPRSAFATPERFPKATLLHDWPDEALERLRPDARTAIVVLSHDTKLDEPALAAALRTAAFYIGALGSSRTQEARRRRLTELGFGEQDLARIHGPIGLDIGALTTAEIAISIMAELTAVRRQGRSRAPLT